MTITFEYCPFCKTNWMRKECYIIPINKKEVLRFSLCFNCDEAWYDYEVIK